MGIFTGSGVAIVTPLNEEGNINFEVFKNLLDFQINNKTDAIIVCGTTGEASTFSDEEQIEAIRFAVAHTNKRIPVIAGTGSNHTDHGIKLCVESQKAGADACLTVTPYYNKATQKGLIAHFTAMAKSTDLPIILYNVPGRTGLNIAPKTAYELSKVENIVAIKEASGDLNQILQLSELCYTKLDIYSGNDDQILPIMTLGGKGVISVIANILPELTHDLCVKLLNNDLEEAREIQLKMLPLVRALFCEVNPIPVKKALNLMGFNAGGHRMPLTEMEDTNVEILKNEMKTYGLI